VQQLRAAFPESGQYRDVIFDHDSKFNEDVIAFLKATGLNVKCTSIQAPWQNGTAERWVGSCRREVLVHIIPVDESHLRRLTGEYVRYRHEDRIHDALRKESPHRRTMD
jgi:transposase InsO family protein